MVKTYMVRIKNNAHRFVSILKLKTVLAKARSLYPKADWHDLVGFEPDSNQRMHLHTMVKFPTNISCRKYAKLFLPGTSWSLRFDPVRKGDEDNVAKYCLKEKRPHHAEEVSYQYFLMRRIKKINLFK